MLLTSMARLLIGELKITNMDIKQYKTVGDWYDDAKVEGYSIPLQMCHGIQIAMKELNMGFAEVFELFEKKRVTILVGKMFIYDLQGYKAIENISNE